MASMVSEANALMCAEAFFTILFGPERLTFQAVPFALVSECIQLGQSDPPFDELESERVEQVLYHAA